MWTKLLRVSLLLVLVAGVSAAPQPGAAQTPPVFTVRNVAVDQTAATAAEARDAALVDGERKAFRRLLERLTPRAQHAQLPRATNQQVADLVENFEVQNERTSAVRYIATYTFRFNPDGVRALLRRANVPFSETYARPLVVLPIYHEGDVAALWDDPNPWLAAWRTLPPADGLQPLIVPLGDLADIGLISAEQAQRGDAERIAELANKYGAGGAILVEALIDRTNPARPAVQIATTRFDGGSGDQTLVESYTASAGEETDALFVRAAAATESAIEEQWKSDVALQFGQEANLVTDVVFAALGDWVAIRDRLAETAMVRRTEVLNLSRNRAQLDLHYIGTESGLRLTLAQKDLVLDRDNAGWRLSLRRAAAQ
jgi:TolA-binding protein